MKRVEYGEGERWGGRRGERRRYIFVIPALCSYHSLITFIRGRAGGGGWRE